MSFGNELKVAREALGLSIQDVAQRTKIRSDYLRALEGEDAPALPERTFSRSYLQSYARELHLDPLPLLRDFDRLVPQPAEQVHRPRPAGQKGRARSGSRRSSGLVGGLLGGVLLLGVAGYLGYSAYQARSTVSAAAQDSTVALPSTRQVKFSLTSAPSGARVYVDNHYLGLTPVRQIPLDARQKAALRVEYGGRQSYSASLSLESDQNLSVALSPLTAAQLAAQAAGAAAPATTTAAAQGQAAPTPPTPNAQTGSVQTSSAQTGTPAQASAPASGVRLRWAGASWTRVVSASGQVLYQGTPAAGSTRDFPSGITVRTGSAGLVTATVSGGQPQPLGAVGAVVTRRF